MLKRVKHYRLKNIRHDTDVLYITLEPKRSRDRLRFYPGQYATLGFKGDSGRLSPMRCFSIVSAPEKPDELQFAMRLGGRFTRSLSELRVGTDMFVQGPFGDFMIDPQYDRNVVLLAGGIGITPFVSMIRSASLTNTSPPITLLHSYRSGHHIPFYEELQQLEARNTRFQVATFVTSKSMAPETPRMFSGKINEHYIQQVVDGKFAGSTYFVCGPQGFMDSVITMLKDHGVSDDRIITESFTQSSKLTTKQGYSIQKLTYTFASLILIAGIGSIAFLDLSRYVPRYTRAAATVQSTQSSPASTATPQPTSDDTTNSNNNDSSSAANTTSPSSSSTNSSPAASTPTTTSNSSSNSSTATLAPTQTYQAPVTSVS